MRAVPNVHGQVDFGAALFDRVHRALALFGSEEETNYASSSGQTAARVQFFEGVPGSNGTVTQTYEGSGSTTITPAVGSHFYYVQVTQGKGKILWSAPIWVNEVSGGGDTTPPTTSASESGSSGTITLSATASDNVGVTKVEFYVDGVLKGTGTTSPYGMTLDSTTLSNGAHALTTKAYDAANNIGTSSAVSFNVSNGDATPPTTTASESGSSGTITLSTTASDNVGVAKVEFYVDGVLKGTDTTSPYSVTLDSTTLANGSHALTSKAYDAAGNVGTSGAVSFSVSNTGGGDTIPPTTCASESGSNGTITLSATASDNVGVTRVEFYVDGALKATDTTSPYSTALDSATLTNGSHSLTSKAYDAAGNVGTSTAVSFSVGNGTGGSELISNGGFESGNTVWSATSGVIDNSSGEPAHAGSWKAWLDGYVRRIPTRCCRLSRFRQRPRPRH